MQILKFNKDYKFYDSFEYLKELPKDKNLKLEEGAFGSLFLTEVQDFEIPEKTYSNDTDFINHVLSTYSKSNKSVGILLTGKKGLGKSFTAKLLCQKLNLPTIIIDKQTNSGMFDLLNQIEQEHIVYIDEFEKIFPRSGGGGDNDSSGKITQESFLSFLDGNTTSKVKRLFIITSNDDVNYYMINRPSRIRYVREYKSISKSIIQEIVDDKLTNKEFKDDLISNLSIDELNIDSLIEIINEINISNKPYTYFKSFFNYTVEESEFDIFLISDNGKVKYLTKRKFTNSNFEYYKACTLNLGDGYYSEKFVEEVNYNESIFEGYKYDGKENKIPCKYLFKQKFNKMDFIL